MADSFDQNRHLLTSCPAKREANRRCIGLMSQDSVRNAGYLVLMDTGACQTMQFALANGWKARNIILVNDSESEVEEMRAKYGCGSKSWKVHIECSKIENYFFDCNLDRPIVAAWIDHVQGAREVAETLDSLLCSQKLAPHAIVAYTYAQRSGASMSFNPSHVDGEKYDCDHWFYAYMSECAERRGKLLQTCFGGMCYVNNGNRMAFGMYRVEDATSSSQSPSIRPRVDHDFTHKTFENTKVPPICSDVKRRSRTRQAARHPYKTKPNPLSDRSGVDSVQKEKTKWAPQEYSVRAILDERRNANRVTEYCVSWDGAWPLTWETRETLGDNCADLFAQYDACKTTTTTTTHPSKIYASASASPSSCCAAQDVDVILHRDMGSCILRLKRAPQPVVSVPIVWALSRIPELVCAWDMHFAHKKETVPVPLNPCVY